MAKTKKKNTKKTNIAIVVDRSGSMNSIWKAALDGLNETVNSLKMNANFGGETTLSVIAFDDHIDLMVEAAPVDVLPEFTNEDIIPRGMTALYDAVKLAIETIGNTDETDDTGYLVTVISDGHENASVTRQNEISNLIKELEATGKWTFNFMLANQDIHQFVNTMGVAVGNVAAFTGSSAGVTSAFNRMNIATDYYFAKRSAGQTMAVDTYSATDTQ